MRAWHSLSWGIDILENGGCFYVEHSGVGPLGMEFEKKYHSKVFFSEDEVYQYVDWCDLYCDRIMDELWFGG